ncbi:DUF6169 family protein [Runella slithyformis]|uniref:Uncharacterized protein n=1 Tax=Runella slithyformis (strain ATCC 29530 / DSM 19594 / LMG 11500 / NCIMB 11436 / LSU 4) TaxID=761193 RepID=A0A7U3ZL28_RUNSL|nr:DUF6169 family protein [Runella slithyformis]AEI49185.1 hypothetical protein Runsl_2792 [Runella slithyformis DSM 19594]
MEDIEKQRIIDENGKQRWEQLEDPRIKATVMIILKEYLEDNIYLSLIYVCSRDKGMDRARNILFNKWFNEAKSEQNYFPNIPISKHNNSFRVNIHDKHLTYATLLTPETCPYQKQIEEAFMDYHKSLIKRSFYYQQK